MNAEESSSLTPPQIRQIAHKRKFTAEEVQIPE
jgi:hypothetical protein